MKYSNSSVVRLGIIGCGNVAMVRHLPALQRIPAIRVAGVCDIDRSRAEKAAGTRPHGVHIYENSDALIDDPDIDAVAVCVPTAFHRAPAERALRAGKHVYLEKPPALTLQDSEALCKAAAESKGISMIGFNLRHHRLVQRALESLRQGQLGAITMIRSVFTSNTRSNKEAPSWRLDHNAGGLLLEQAIHHFDLWRCLLGSEVVEIRAVLANNSAEAGVLATMTGNVPATASFSEQTTETNEVEIYCEGGLLRISLYEFDGLEIMPTGVQMGSISRRVGRALKTAAALPDAVRGMREGGEYVASYRSAWESFASCIQTGVPATPGIVEGVRALAVVLAARESAANGGTTIRIPAVMKE